MNGKWTKGQAVLELALFVAVAGVLSLFLWRTPISDSSYLSSGVPQCLGAIRGLLAAFVALGSQMAASVSTF